MRHLRPRLGILPLCLVPFLLGSCEKTEPVAERAPGKDIVRGLYVGSDIISCELWTRSGVGSEIEHTLAHSGRSSMRCRVEEERGDASARQTVTFNQTQPREVVVSGWSKADNVSGKQDHGYSIYLDLKHTDGTPLFMKTVEFATGSHDWQRGETVIKPEKPLASASVNVFLRKHTGTVWFDDVQICERNPDGSLGPNLVRNGGFEADGNLDRTERQKIFDAVKGMNANAIHVYVGATAGLWCNPFQPPPAHLPDAFAEFVDDAHRNGLGVWVTLGPRLPDLRSTKDPEFPYTYCVNGLFGEDWIKTIGAIAKYPIDAVGMVPDEYNYCTSYAKERYAKSQDPDLAKFYQGLPTYCACEQCRKLFAQKYGGPLPSPADFKTHDKAMRDYLQFRYDSTFDWIRKSVAAAKASNPAVRTDSLICVSPICSDMRRHSGVAWDMIGYGSGIDFLTTDPYILLHNYRGDSTHYYVSETANHLVGSSKTRGGGVVLEICQLRAESRPLEDVEVYGTPLTSIAHGAGEVFYFHISCLLKNYAKLPDPKRNEGFVRQAFHITREVSPWLRGSRKPREIAFLYSRASDDMFQIYTNDPKPAFIAHRDRDPRYPFIAQKEVMYFLFRHGYSFEFFPLEQVGMDEIKDFRVILVPFPFAISKKQAALLRDLAQAGKKVILISEVGTVDELGNPYDSPLLLDLAGLSRAPSGEADSEIAFDAQSPFLPGKKIAGQFAVYSDLSLAPGARLIASGGQGKGGIVLNKVGSGEALFLGGEFGIRIPKQPVEVHKGNMAKVPQPPLDAGHVEVMGGALDYALGGRRLLRLDKTIEQDVEAVVRTNDEGDVILFLINWDNTAAEFKVGLDLPDGRYRVEEAGLDGMQKSDLAGRTVGAGDVAGVPMRLAPQEAKILRFAKGR